MKRFGRLLLNPAQVLAIIPTQSNGVMGGISSSSFAIYFFNGTMAIVSAAEAAPLIEALAPAEANTAKG